MERNTRGIGYFVFSCSYSSTGHGASASSSASDSRRVSLGKYKMGDVVGCGIDWTRERYFFTLNGRKEGKINPQLGLSHALTLGFRRPPMRFPEEANVSSG